MSDVVNDGTAVGLPPASQSGGPRSGRVASVDWLEASVKELDTGRLFELLERHLGPACGRLGCEVLRDDEKGFDAKGPLGLRVRADRVGQVDRTGARRPWAGVRLPGELCRAVGTDRVLDLVEAMGQAGDLKVSRLDGALDDFDKTFSPRKFAEACVAGRLDDESARLSARVVTRVRGDNWEWSRRKGGCFWLGGRGSARLLRVYDKDQESRGLIPSTRIELQCRDDFATALCAQLLAARQAGRPLAEPLLGYLVEFVDLREPQGPRSACQTWQRIGWWHAVVGDAADIPTAKRADTEVWAWIAAMAKQFGGFLVVMLRAAGVTARVYALGRTDPEAAVRVVSAVVAILGPVMQELTGEQSLRLDQLMRENGSKLRDRRRALGLC